MKLFAVVLSEFDSDLEIKFYRAEDWRGAVLQAAKDASEDYPIWNCLDVPDEAMKSEENSDEDIEEPTMVPLTLSEAIQDAANNDANLAVVEVPA